jgi:hypothetical protein
LIGSFKISLSGTQKTISVVDQELDYSLMFIRFKNSLPGYAGPKHLESAIAAFIRMVGVRRHEVHRRVFKSYVAAFKTWFNSSPVKGSYFRF